MRLNNPCCKGIATAYMLAFRAGIVFAVYGTGTGKSIADQTVIDISEVTIEPSPLILPGSDLLFNSIGGSARVSVKK